MNTMLITTHIYVHWKKSLLQISGGKQCKLVVLNNSVCIGGMKCLVGKKVHFKKLRILELFDELYNFVTVA